MSSPSSSSSAVPAQNETPPGGDQPTAVSAAGAASTSSASASGAVRINSASTQPPAVTATPSASAGTSPNIGCTSTARHSPDSSNRYGTRRKLPLSVHTSDEDPASRAQIAFVTEGGAIITAPVVSPRPRSSSTSKDRKRKPPRSASASGGDLHLAGNARSHHSRSSSVADSNHTDAIYYPQTRNGSFSGGHKQLPAQLCHRILNGLLLHGRLSMQSLMTLLPELGSTSSLRDHAMGILEVLEVLGLVKCIRVDDLEAVRRKKRKLAAAGGAGADGSSSKPAAQVKAETEDAALTEEQQEAKQASHEQELLDSQAQAHVKAQALSQAQAQHIAQAQAQSAALAQAQAMRLQQIDQVYAQLAQLEELGRQGHPGQTPAEVEIRVNHIAKLYVWIQQANTQKDAGAAQIAAHTHQTAAQTAGFAQQVQQQASIVSAAIAAARENVLAQTLVAKHTSDCQYVLTGYAKCNTDVPFLNKDVHTTIEAKLASAAAITSRTESLIKLSNEMSDHSAEGSSALRQKLKGAKAEEAEEAEDAEGGACASKTSTAQAPQGSPSPSASDARVKRPGTLHYKHKQERLTKLRSLVSGFVDEDATLQDDSIYRAILGGGLDLAAAGCRG